MPRARIAEAPEVEAGPRSANGREPSYPLRAISEKGENVPSVDDAIKKVKAAGGKVVTPTTPIPGMGAYGRVADTEGNVIGLFQSNQ